MGLETATYISDLVTTNPTATDPKSQGDDHLRLIKSTVKATFPNVTGALTPTHTELNYVSGVTSAIQTQINTKGAIAGQSWTGTHNFSGATNVSLPANSSIGTVSATEISYVDGVTSPIQIQLDAKADITGETYSGSHDFTGATLRAGTKAFGSSGTEVATIDYVNNATFVTNLPAQTGNDYKFLTTVGGVASWASVTGSDLYLFNSGIV